MTDVVRITRDLAPPHKGQSRGTWRAFAGGATIACPECGQVARLDHRIDTDGKVSPSVACAAAACGFHRFVVLAGWMGGG